MMTTEAKNHKDFPFLLWVPVSAAAIETRGNNVGRDQDFIFSAVSMGSSLGSKKEKAK